MSTSLVRTLLLTFSPAFNAPPIALIASHRSGFPTVKETLRVFLECLSDTAPDPSVDLLNLVALLAGSAPSAVAPWTAQLSELGWDLGELHAPVAHVAEIDTLLRPERPGFTLLPDQERPAHLAAFYAFTGLEGLADFEPTSSTRAPADKPPPSSDRARRE